MTLDNSAKIGDIIMALEGMQAINQKAELASVIGSPATATDNIATQITKIQDAKDVIATKTGQENTLPLLELANGINIGFNFKTGDYGRNGSSLVVDDLDFRPKIVVARQVPSSGLFNYCVVYVDTSVFNPNTGTLNFKISTGQQNGDMVITDNGFSTNLPSNQDYTWIAIG